VQNGSFEEAGPRHGQTLVLNRAVGADDAGFVTSNPFMRALNDCVLPPHPAFLLSGARFSEFTEFLGCEKWDGATRGGPTNDNASDSVELTLEGSRKVVPPHWIERPQGWRGRRLRV